MSTISLRLPDSLHRAVRDLARKEKVSMDQMISVAVAEKVSALAPPIYDIGANLKAIEEKLRKEHGKRRISFKVNAPADQRIAVAGGEFVEDVIFSILNNSVKHTKAEEARVAVIITPITGEAGRPFWRISIEDEGPGISDTQKLNIANPFDGSQRFSRGVGSTISFMSAITKHFGGKLWIEDRVPGTQANGTRVVVTLPSAEIPQNN